MDGYEAIALRPATAFKSHFSPPTLISYLKVEIGSTLLLEYHLTVTARRLTFVNISSANSTDVLRHIEFFVVVIFSFI